MNNPRPCLERTNSPDEEKNNKWEITVQRDKCYRKKRQMETAIEIT